MSACVEMVQTRRPSIMAKGTESNRIVGWHRCTRPALPGDEVCAQHAAARVTVRAELARRRAAR